MSSEAPVERYDWRTGERYLEVLDHAAGAVDLSYARDGVPFLLDHSMRVQIGLVEDVRLDADRKLRGTVTMGHHPDARWVEKDIRAGIRKKISVGYDPGNTYEVVSAKDDKVPVRRYRGWKLFEASSVAVPADYDVGVARSAFGDSAREVGQSVATTGREAQLDGVKMTDEGKQTSAPSTVGVAVARDHDAERKARLGELANIAALARSVGVEASVEEALRNDWTPAEFMARVSELSIKKAGEGVPAGRVDFSARERREYSLMRALRLAAESQTAKRAPANSFEFEVSDEIAKSIGRSPQTLFIPLSLTADRDAAAMHRASVTGNISGTTSLGGAGVQTSVQSMIEILRNSSVLDKVGIRRLDGLTGNVLFPRQTGTNTWSWEGENPSTAKALTAAIMDSYSLSPKTGYGATAYSKQFLVQASFSAEQWLREDLARIAALGIDKAGLHGLGTSNEPTGIFVQSGTGSVLMATNGATPTWAKLVEFETTAAVANALQGNLAYISTPGVRGYLKTNLKNTVAGSEYLCDRDGTINGYPTFYTNQVRTDLTAGTSTTICHGLVFGNWSEGQLATWGDALDVLVDPYTYATQGMIRIVESAMVDFGWRHPASFVVSTSVKTS